MTDHSPTCALLVRHEACDCFGPDIPKLADWYRTEAPSDRAARLALDLGRAKRRIAELEAAESRVRALLPEWAETIDDDERWYRGPKVSTSEAQELPGIISRARSMADDLRAALDSPDDQVREVPT